MLPPPAPVVVIHDDPGGTVDVFARRIARYGRVAVRVEVRGECASACTMVLALGARVCAGPHAAFGFHQAYTPLRRDPYATWNRSEAGTAALMAHYPWGTLSIWPVPASTLYQVHLVFKADLVQFAALSDQVELPPEYDDAIVYNLAARLRISYGEPPDAAVDALARAALAAIRAANVQVPSLTLAATPCSGGGGSYNVYSDQGR